MAISRERLEELIKQGATIWGDDFGEIKLDKNTCEICDVKGWSTGEHIYWALYFEYKYNNQTYHHDINIDKLEEDVETAQWHYEMDCSRVETLELPTWKEINEFENTKMFCEFYANDVDYDFCKYILDRDLKNDNLIIIRYGFEDNAGDVIWEEKYTKENYILACRYCVKLFKGEE